MGEGAEKRIHHTGQDQEKARPAAREQGRGRRRRRHKTRLGRARRQRMALQRKRRGVGRLRGWLTGTPREPPKRLLPAVVRLSCSTRREPASGQSRFHLAHLPQQSASAASPYRQTTSSRPHRGRRTRAAGGEAASEQSRPALRFVASRALIPPSAPARTPQSSWAAAGPTRPLRVLGSRGRPRPK